MFIPTHGNNAAVLGSTTNFDFPAEELDQFQKDHSQNGNSAGPSTEEDDEDESLVYVPSPKVLIIMLTLLFQTSVVSIRIVLSTVLTICHAFQTLSCPI